MLLRHAGLRNACLLLPSVLLLASCAAPRSPFLDTNAALTSLQPVFSGDKVTKCLGTPVEVQRSCRDEIAQSMLVAIDLRYAEYEIQFFDANRAAGFGSAVTLLGLGAAGSLAGTGTAQVISAVSGAVAGTREAFGRDLLAEDTAGALLTAMRTQRNIVGIRIREGLQAPADRYPLGVALSDLFAYYRAGTIPGAIVGVTQAVGTQGQLSQDELRRAVPVSQGKAAVCLQRLFSPSLRQEAVAENRQRVRRAMTEEGIATSLSLSDFVFGPPHLLDRAAQQRLEEQQSAVAARLNCQ